MKTIKKSFFFFFLILFFLFFFSFKIKGATICTDDTTFAPKRCDFDEDSDTWSCPSTSSRTFMCGDRNPPYLQCETLDPVQTGCSGLPNSCSPVWEYVDCGTEEVTPTPTPYHYICSNKKCVKTAGSGTNQCSSGSYCISESWGSCSNSCGDGNKTCNCSGSCCVGCDGTSCGGTASCCECSNSCYCDAATPNYQNQCSAPYCGQHVCDTTYGQRCRGSSCAQNCQKTNCGYCADWRSASLTMGTTFVHDMPIPLSGVARDNNGATDGVEDVHIYRESGNPGSDSDDIFWTSFGGNGISIKPNDPNAGSFNGNLTTPNTANLYNVTGGRNGANHTITLDFWAVQNEPNVCPNWKFDTRTITLTNNPPSQNSNETKIQFKKTDGSLICENTSCNDIPLLSYTLDNILQVSLLIKDTDPYPTGIANFNRASDIENARIIFDNDNDPDNGHFYSLFYTDTGNGDWTLSELGSKASFIDFAKKARNYDNASKTLTITFNLDFSQFPKSENFQSNVYLWAKDFAGAQTPIMQRVFSSTLYPPYWYKLKDASLIKKGGLVNYLPLTVSPYDPTDNSERYLIIGNAGVVSTENNILILGAVPPDLDNQKPLLSLKHWYTANYSKSSSFFVEEFLGYSKTKKGSLVKITNPSEIQENKINFLLVNNSTFTLNEALKQYFEKNKTVIILRNNNNTDFVDLVFEDTITNFNSSLSSVAIIAKRITFSNNLENANGIFIANGFDLKNSFNYSTTPLKITGNLISLSEIVDTTVRRRQDITKPSIFIVFSPSMYLDLLPYLSTANYKWEEKGP